MTSDLFLAILAMDAYNRAGGTVDNRGLIVAGNSIGNAVIDEASEIDNVNFFAQSYNIGIRPSLPIVELTMFLVAIF
ncbi:MAG: hypothetical protein ACXWKP_26350 [Bradyrhizobium sp.]